MAGKLVYLLLAEGFEETEALCTLDVLRRGGLNAKTVAVGKDLLVYSTHGVGVKADLLLEDVVGTQPAAVVLPGGMPGANNLDTPEVRKMLLDADARGDLVCAICAAPKLPGKLGLLKGKKAVCFPGFESELTGADLQKKHVVRDGNVITAIGMGASLEFGLAILIALGEGEKADRIAASVFA